MKKLSYSEFIKKHRLLPHLEYMKTPLFIHMEVTTRCAVGCPQCYCTSQPHGIDMPYDLFEKTVCQASEMGIPCVLLTGGEPLCYPALIQGVALLSQHHMQSVISTSGLGLTEKLCISLKEAGLTECHVSLNGSCREIHNLSRNLFEVSLQAISLLKTHGLFCGVHWVARKDNLQDFPHMVELCKQMGVDRLTIIRNKQHAGFAAAELDNRDLSWLSDYIQKLNLPHWISVEVCYEELKLALHRSPTYMQSNCCAGRIFMDVMADGSYSPCRHVVEATTKGGDTLTAFWEASPSLNAFRMNHKQRSCLWQINKEDQL